jgi:hypothetical protein
MTVAVTVQQITSLANGTSNVTLNVTGPGTLGAQGGQIVLNGVPTANLAAVLPNSSFTATFA